MKAKILLIIMTLACSINGYSQKISSRQIYSDRDTSLLPLTPGQHIPDLVFNELIHSNTKTIHLSDLTRGKLLIIDFFATWCGSCISALPNLDSLQRKFGDKLIILPVTYEPKATVLAFLKRHPEIARSPMYFASGDVALAKLFPHRIVPHEVWISNDGTFISTSDDNDVTAKNISGALSGSFSGLTFKTDQVDFNINKPLLVNGNGGKDDAFLYRSLLTSFNQGIASEAKIVRNKDNLITRIVCTNIDPGKLYTIAYSHFLFAMVNHSRTVINIDTADYMAPWAKEANALKNWSPIHAYCYELDLPPATPDLFYQCMMEDLNRYFKIKGTVEHRETACWKLIRTSKDDGLIASKGGEVAYAHMGMIRNAPLSNLVSFLMSYANMEPIIDDTGFRGPVDIDLPFVHHFDRSYYPDMKVVKACLNKYGLDLVKTEQPYDVLVLSYKN